MARLGKKRAGANGQGKRERRGFFPRSSSGWVARKRRGGRWAREGGEGRGRRKREGEGDKTSRRSSETAELERGGAAVVDCG